MPVDACPIWRGAGVAGGRVPRGVPKVSTGQTIPTSQPRLLLHSPVLYAILIPAPVPVAPYFPVPRPWCHLQFQHFTNQSPESLSP